eukprot:6169361-Ditylum_brightwellii.AAC.2
MKRKLKKHRQCGRGKRKAKRGQSPRVPASAQELIIHILKFNCGLIPANLHEICLHIEYVKPDIVLIQETQLCLEQVPQFLGYHCIQRD